MKVLVVTNRKGEVIATARPAAYTNVHIAVAPMAGQRVHDLEVPESLADLKCEDLHKKLREYLPKEKPRKSSD
jgi:hypothetical protein